VENSPQGRSRQEATWSTSCFTVTTPERISAGNSLTPPQVRDWPMHIIAKINFIHIHNCLCILWSSGSECSPPVAPHNGHLEPLQSNYIFKDHLTLTCDPGYSLRQVRRRTHFTCADKGSDYCKLIETDPYTVLHHSHILSYRVIMN